MSRYFLEIQEVTKQYDGHLAVNNVSLHIPVGEIYGLLGPNGAGKTSIIRMITGITGPDKGKILFDGSPFGRHHLTQIGYMPEERGLYKKMKVIDQIVYLLSLKGLRPKKAKQTAYEWLERLGLKDWDQKLTSDLSKGMQQKVQFISTVAHKPRLLILDEPFSGLDPVNTKVMEDEIMQMKADGTTIIFSTHRMEQVEELCDFIGLMNKGQLMIENRLSTVRKQFQKGIYRIGFNGDKSIILEVPHIQVQELEENYAMIQLREGQTSKGVLRALLDSDLDILRYEQYLPRLNDIFIELVGRSTGQPIATPTEEVEENSILPPPPLS